MRKGASMPKGIPEAELAAIEDAVRSLGGRATVREIEEVLPIAIPRRTLQYRLKNLVDAGRLLREGHRRWTKYRLPPSEDEASGEERVIGARDVVLPLSPAGAEMQQYLRRPLGARDPVGYNRDFLESYRPNESFYLTEAERAHLAEAGKTDVGAQTAGTYAKQILSRLLIDLSWNSSRLEGNTYSLLDTRRLIEFGEEPDGRDRREAQMILNHKDAIEFLVSSAEEIGFNRYTILNLHAILANNLLTDMEAAGRLRYIAIGIDGSSFHPLEIPQLVEEFFDRMLATAAAIEDPFEQAFFVMIQLPYLQPFDDVNKRVSRLAANIPFIRRNLSPLSFTDVPRSTYTDALLGVYERNRIELFKDVFLWAYERSAARYAAMRQSLGEPDPFRLRHRDALLELVGEIVRERMGRKLAVTYIASWTSGRLPPMEQERFREIAESELLGLHQGNFARYRLTPREFDAWQEEWARR
jgi:hypothetical protein